jgi:hypothetical protein
MVEERMVDGSLSILLESIADDTLCNAVAQVHFAPEVRIAGKVLLPLYPEASATP